MEHMRGKFWKDVFGEFAVSDEDWERDLESFDFATFSKNMDDLNMFGLVSICVCCTYTCKPIHVPSL